MVMRETDFPIGWQGTPYKADPGAAADSAALVRCVGTRNATVSSSAFSFRSQRDVDSDVAMQRSAKLPRRQSAMFVTIAFITGPLIEAEVDTVGSPQPVPEALVTSLVTMVAARATMG